MNNPHILLLKFDELVQKSLYEMLCRAGHTVDIAKSYEEAKNLLDKDLFHVILTDINGTRDVKTIGELKKTASDSEVIVLASYGNMEAAVECMRMGAFDYFVRPVKDHKILSAITRATSEDADGTGKRSRKRKSIPLDPDKEGTAAFYDLVGTSDKSKEIYSLIDRISSSKATVLLQGESGTGKRMIAHAIHKADKKRCKRAFIEVSCGALPREIIESELFGHTKGAFTGAVNDRKGRFELAHGGTILLDDIDSLPLDLQVKLLRVLQQREFERVGDHRTMRVDVRVIATTNQDIKKAVAEKRFREDLYYRIDVISIHVPSLKERKEDLPLLIDHFVSMYSKENHKNIKGMSEEAMHAIVNYNWPGNIRELENIIERAVILDTDSVIDKDDLPGILLNKNIILNPEASHNFLKNIATTLKEALHEPEKVHIIRVLKEVGWNKKKAAKKLGVNRTTLYNKLRKYNLISQLEENKTD